jgi:hypothetical protein
MQQKRLFKNTKKLSMPSVLFLMLQGCSTTVPLTMSFPEVPPSLMESAPTLKTLSQTKPELSDILENASENYGSYYELRERYLAWQDWYKQQKKIYEDVK